MYYLEADGIACDCGKPSVPDPFEHVHGALDTGVLELRAGRIGLLGRDVHDLVPLLGDADAHEQDVALLKRDITLGGNLFDVAQGDCV
jgi:hypothetical protein